MQQEMELSAQCMSTTAETGRPWTFDGKYQQYLYDVRARCTHIMAPSGEACWLNSALPLVADALGVTPPGNEVVSLGLPVW